MSENIEDYVILDDEPVSLISKLKKIPMTYYLVGVNVIVFLLIHITNFLIADNWLLVQLMKNTEAIALNGEIYRLFTAVFTHVDLYHIFFNCMALIILGKPIEQILGEWKFLIIFLVAGLFGSLASFIFSANNAIGASGGVFGLFGVHFYLLMINKKVYLKVFGNEIFKLLLINVVIGFLVPNIDYYGHFGGILGGFLATLSLGLGHKLKVYKNLIVGMLLTCILFSGSLLYFDHNYQVCREGLENYIDQANDAINRNDLLGLKETRTALKETIPLLPPVPEADFILNQIDDIIEKAE